MFEKTASKWKAQFAVNDNCEKTPCETTFVGKGFVAAADDNNKIYVLLVNASSTEPPGGVPLKVSTLNFWLAVGTVDTAGDEKIKWEVKEKLILSNDEKFTSELKEQELGKRAFSGFTIVKEEKIIFLLRAQRKDKKTVFGFFELDGKEKAKTLQFLLFDEITQDCYPQFFYGTKK